MEIIALNPVSDKRWLEFIENREDCSIFHHPSWIRVLQNQYSFSAFCLCSTGSDKRITGGIVICEVRGITGTKKWISLPFTDHCMPLADSSDELKLLLSYLSELAAKKKIANIEIRFVSPGNSGFANELDSYLHVLTLDKRPGEIFRSFDKTRVQQCITKSQKEELRVTISHSAYALEEFYKLHLKTRRKLGVPVQSKQFFKCLFTEIIESQMGFICMVEKNSTSLSAGIFAGYSKTLTYKYGASDPQMLHLKPNHLMLWGAIQEAHKRGFRFFDFGKTDLDNKGLRDFKNGWAAVESELYYSYSPKPPGDKLPGFLMKKFIPSIIRKSPAFVCRWSGELFYKYFA